MWRLTTSVCMAARKDRGRGGRRVRDLARRWLPGQALTYARAIRGGLPLPRWGNLRRTAPFSDRFGFDRGTPIDRYYLHRFLSQHASLITGDVLEIQVRSYTERFGVDVRTSHTLDIVADFSPTFVCDLAAAEGVVPDAAYDCFLLPNTLQHLRSLEPALVQALRVVRPGGVVMASAAGLERLTEADQDFWRFTPRGWELTVERVWAGCEVQVRGHGNCLAVAAAAYGLAVEELTPAELEVVDDRFPVLTTILCRKP